MSLRMPTAVVPFILDITPEMLKKMGVRAVLLDVDNTLSHHDAPKPFDGTVEWTRKMRENGFQLMIVSNNKEDRVRKFSAQFDLPFVWRACKPLPVGYLKASRKLGVPHRETVIIGDQVYTDVIGANCIGMKSILVEPAEPETGWSFRIRRRYERSVRRKCFKDHTKQLLKARKD